jgi:hypothetical protein
VPPRQVDAQIVSEHQNRALGHHVKEARRARLFPHLLG